MAEYAFATIWRLDAPIDRVYELIEDVTRWPAWWPSVLEVRELTPGEEGVGAAFAFTFRGRLPYLLRFDLRTTRHEPPTALEGRATGELEGEGRWSLRADGDRTVVRYDWQIRTTRWWMNLFAPLPFVDAIFRLNHHAVMRDGLAGARRELGVGGSYTRLD
jgi:hypothetical protein